MATEEQGPQPLPREGGWSRLVGTVVDPRATFKSIARKPTWLLPVLLIVLVNLAVTYRQQRPGNALTVPNAALEQRLKSNPAFEKLTPKQQAHEVKEARAIARGMITGAVYFGVVIGTPLVFLIVAGVLLLAFKFVYGAGIRLRQSYAITSFASVPYLISSVVTLVLVWTHPPGAHAAHELSLVSLEAFLSPHAPLWLKGLTRSVNVFDLWTLGLLAVGYTAASPKKVRFGGALAVVMTAWAIYLVAVASLASKIPHR